MPPLALLARPAAACHPAPAARAPDAASPVQPQRVAVPRRRRFRHAAVAAAAPATSAAAAARPSRRELLAGALRFGAAGVSLMASVDDVAEVAALPRSLSSALPQSPRAAGSLERSAAREFEVHMPLPLKPISPHVPRPDGTPASALPAQATCTQAPAPTAAEDELEVPSHARRLLVCGFAVNACPFQALLQPSRPDAAFMQLADVAADMGAERLLSALPCGALPIGLLLVAVSFIVVALHATSAAGSLGAAGGDRRLGRRLQQGQPWFDTTKTVDQRVDALLNSMTLAQMKAQMESTDAGAIPSLGVTAFKYQRECLHGMVGDNGESVMYPMPIAWGATFDDGLVWQAALEIGDAMRAFSNREMYYGRGPSFTHCYGPHPAIVRDPRWGRSAEVYSEDPKVASNMANMFIQGLQGGWSAQGASTPLKVSATCKHLIGNDLENWYGITRYNLNALIDYRDLRDTFWLPFESCVRAGAAAIMCSYNKVNNEPACLSKTLLTTVLRQQLGFKGFVATDCDALEGYAKPAPEGMGYGDLRTISVQALRAGSDQACKKWTGLNVNDVTPAEIREAARRILRVRVRLGHFDPPRAQQFSYIPWWVIGSANHLATARKMVQESIVLLKNTQNALPLARTALRRVHLVGPWADNGVYQLGSYYAIPAANNVTPRQALQTALPGVTVTYSATAATGYTAQNVATDAQQCQLADVCILFLGSRMHRYLNHNINDRPTYAYDRIMEGEGRDRTSLKLNPNQEALWKDLVARTSKKIVVVLMHGGGLDISDMMRTAVRTPGARISAVMTTWFPGQGAPGIADVLLGNVAPAGRLPTTWYTESYTALNMADMRMRSSTNYPGRTYRYWRGAAPLFPFGYGLSYSTWAQQAPALVSGRGDGQPGARASITLRNTGTVTSDHVVILFMAYEGPNVIAGRAPNVTLSRTKCAATGRTDLVQSQVGYQRAKGLAPGASQRLTFGLSYVNDFSNSWAGFGDPVAPCGVYALRFNVGQPIRLRIRLA
ncbi:putative beta-D-xylosidase 7 [Chlorella sorokiniana]|uniref:Beta-D-xylosidase 7 n=1 Tax=Chlorella sorokiniana TaxID=3076 RepID=A0A2P6TID9_CHLSO|nr:putative beta-D-xylosidase 7 [Chlorella sorokiniana]|eukprot:PRW34064.1 putative beta-D-xylosidase 7 [Chlorella sorokiniana]